MRCPRYEVKFLTTTIHLLSSIYTLPTHRFSSERHLDPAGNTDGVYTMLDLARLTADSPLPLLGPHLPTLVISTLACFAIQNLSHIITPRILGRKWETFDKKTRRGWASHCVCTSHMSCRREVEWLIFSDGTCCDHRSISSQVFAIESIG